MVDEVERPAEREVLHLPDPVRTARTSSSASRRTIRYDSGAARLIRAAPDSLELASTWTRSSSSPSTPSRSGSVYALIALGYTLVYGVLKLLNFAHGDVFMVGSFIGFGVLQLLGGAVEPGRAGLAPARADHARRDGRLRGARRRDRALRLPAAPRRAADRAADQRARRLVLPRELDAAPVRRAAPRNYDIVRRLERRRSTSRASTSATCTCRCCGSSRSSRRSC